MNQQRKMYMQKIFNPNQYRSNGMTTLNKENFARIMTESITKAINCHESPVKEKHVRKLLIGTFQAESGSFFWQYLAIIRLKENQIACWKFCHVLHKLLRDGHKQVVTCSYERRQVLLDCGNMWRHVEGGYGQLIHKYCTLLYNRVNFLAKNPRFPNDLKVSDEQLDEICERDVNVFFDLSCEIFDALDDILRLQEAVLCNLDLKKYSSMTSAGQCHLAPLVACIQDSSQLYDYSVKILFKLHSMLPASTLGGHRDRFSSQHKALKQFYNSTSNLQYFKTLIQIPSLTERPPNFLIASDLQQHVTPQVVMISNPERDSPDASQADYSEQLVNLRDEDCLVDEPSANSSSSNSNTTFPSMTNDNSIDAMLSQTNISDEQGTNSSNDGRIAELEAVVFDLRNQIDTLTTLHTQTKENLEDLLASTKSRLEDLLKKKEAELKKFKDEFANMKHQYTLMKRSEDKVLEACKRAQHENEISQEAMKKLVKDLSDLKSENASLRRNPPSAGQMANGGDEKQNDILQSKIRSLNLQIQDLEAKCKRLQDEKHDLVSTKIHLEKKLDNQQEDILVAEMNEADKIIKEATRKIEELSEKSRKLESGVKLQVNEKISEVCSNLMKAVRNLIIQSRLLQREIVGEDGKSNSEDFYKRNSSWTEGLISAANVVAMAARSLVDSADRAMSGEARYSELAAAAHEIAAATTQLVCASRVKANKDSEKLKILTNAAKQVNQCTGNVVDTARVCAELIEKELDKVDIGSLSLHQTKKMEMETQVKLLELEDQLSKERIKLGLLRRQHYEQENAQETSTQSAVE